MQGGTRRGSTAAAPADMKDASMVTTSRPIHPRGLRTALGLSVAILGLLGAAQVPAAARDAGQGVLAGDAVDATPAPDCVHYYSDWRYTTVVNDCGTTVDVTVQYTDGQGAPCRTVLPGAIATFAGYGPQLNYVTGLSACTPSSV
ncbi:alpha-amylase [Streptomyces sp. BF23-18]|uniref:alpha-amylase n=1 Tax=unclassified Streptomyces TaxID=2593676 RepID=UPI0034E5D4B2